MPHRGQSNPRSGEHRVQHGLLRCAGQYRACHPNVYGVIIIGLGCETVPHRKLKEKIERLTKKPVVSFGIQEEGGTLKTIEKATRAAREMAQQAGSQQKERFDASELYIGIECGGSDATSGIASNPSVGEMSDILVDMGATTVMSESIEWIGGEHILSKRAATQATRRADYPRSKRKAWAASARVVRAPSWKCFSRRYVLQGKVPS